MKRCNPKNILRRSGCMVLCLCVCFGITACKSGTSENTPGEEKREYPLIGLSMDSFVIERWQRDRDVFVSTAEELGAQVIMQNANEDPDEQIRQIEYLISKKVDVLVIIPNDAQKLTGVLKKARENGIKIIAYDRLIQDVPIDLYISFDHVAVGKLMAKELVRKVPKGNYVVITGPHTDNNVEKLRQGYAQVFDSAPGVKVLDEFYCDNWVPEAGANFFSQLLTQGKTIDAVLCGNDSIARAVTKILSEKRLADKVPVVAQDAELGACQSIAEGTQLATVYKNVTLLAQKSAEMAVQLAKGKTVSGQETVENGAGNVPFYKIEPKLITKDTIMDTVIKDGFHRVEDVYRNVPKKDWPVQ